MRSKKPKRKTRMARSPMKQGQTPLKRSKPLRAKKRLDRRTPLESTGSTGSTGSRGSTPIRRSGGLRQTRPEAMTAAEKAAAQSWHRRTLRRCEKLREHGSVLLVCPVCGKPHREDRIQAHHVIAKERIKRYVNGLRLPLDEALALLISLLWDHRNGLPACVRCHDKHTKAVKRIPRALLDRKHEQFAAELGLAYVLDREYV